MSTSPIRPEENDLDTALAADGESESRIGGLPLYVWVVLAVLLQQFPRACFGGATATPPGIATIADYSRS